MAQSVKHLTLAQVMISRLRSLSPASGSVLTAQSLDGACFRLCVSLSLSKIKIKKKKGKWRKGGGATPPPHTHTQKGKGCGT